jgi:hypothetical protein
VVYIRFKFTAYVYLQEYRNTGVHVFFNNMKKRARVNISDESSGPEVKVEVDSASS